MKKLILSVILLFIVSALFAKRLAVLPEILKPETLVVAGNRLYINSQSGANQTIYAYSTGDFKFLKQFVKSGEGPGEARAIVSLANYPDFLAIEDYSTKIMYYSREGEYIKEKRIPQDCHYISCLGENFLGQLKCIDDKKGTEYSTINFFDKEFNMTGILHKGEELEVFKGGKGTGKKVLRIIRNALKYQLYKDRIYVFDTQRGFSIIVYDSRGNRLHEIIKEYKKIRIPKSFIDNFVNRMERTRGWDRLKTKYDFDFPEYYPAYFSGHSLVNDEKIYIFTYETKKSQDIEKRELVVLDLKGNILKRMFVPDSNIYSMRSIDNNSYYYLLENEEKEVWELHAEKIK